MWSFELAIRVAMIGVNSVFAGYEIALASVSLARLQRFADENRRGAATALYMKKNMEASLAVVQLGITLVGVIAAVVGGAGAEESLAPALMARYNLSEQVAEFFAIVFVVVPLTTVTIIFGELIPKVFALQNAEWICLKISPAMRWFSFSVWPAVRLFETVVRGFMSWSERKWKNGGIKKETMEIQELQTIAALARASRLIGHREEGIILGATKLQTRQAKDVMLTADGIAMMDVNASLMDNLLAAHLDMHTRFPVVEQKDDPQTIIGYVNVKDIIAIMRLSPLEPTLRAIVRPLPSFCDNQPIAECLEQLMREHTHIALVRDSENKVVGIISMEDILEELVGEIEDEYDRLPAHATASGSSWVAGGGISLDRLESLTGIDLKNDLPAAGAASLSDWVTGHLGREVRGGDIVERGRVRVAVRKIRRKKVQEAQVSLTEETSGPSSKEARPETN